MYGHFQRQTVFLSKIADFNSQHWCASVTREKTINSEISNAHERLQTKIDSESNQKKIKNQTKQDPKLKIRFVFPNIERSEIRMATKY